MMLRWLRAVVTRPVDQHAASVREGSPPPPLAAAAAAAAVTYGFIQCELIDESFQPLCAVINM